MTKPNVSEIERGARFFMRFVSATMDVARERVVPFAVIERLTTAGGRATLDKMVELAYVDWVAEQSKPAPQPEDRQVYRGDSPLFSAPIVYVQPEFEELRRRFPAYVHLDYRGRRLDPIERCKGVSIESHEVAFEYVQIDDGAETYEVLRKMDRHGLRPALYEELLGFALKHPHEQRKYQIIALGSEVCVDDDRHVAYLYFNDKGLSLDLCWIEVGWCRKDRFLAVRTRRGPALMLG